MMNKILLLLLLAGLASGCGQEDPNAPSALRKALFKQMLKESEKLSGMLRGRLTFNEMEFARGASHLAELSGAPWQHFPPPESQEKSSNARQAVWQQQARFAELARALEEAADQLQQASAQKPLSKEALSAPMQRVELACKACHQEFRRF